MSIRARVPSLNKEEEHLAIRLGMAVIYQWDDLPGEVQEKLLGQATFVETQPTTVQLKQQLEAFIAAQKGE